MDAIEFFSAGLRDIAPVTTIAQGVCGLHNRPARLMADGVCRGCNLLRQTYPIQLKSGSQGRTRLGLGCYMLITESHTEYWGKHQMPASITTHQATGAIRLMIKDLILDPPTPPWMFIAFARSNSTERLRVTTSNDLMQFSGKFAFPGSRDEPFVQRLNRQRVMAMRDAADLTRDQWDACAKAHAALHSSTEALALLQTLYAEHPKLARYPIPAAKTPEYHALRLLAREA